MGDHYFDAKFKGLDWTQLKAKYRPEASAAADDEHLYVVINRMLVELQDSHTAAGTPQESNERRERQRARIGIRLRRFEEHWIVSDVMPKSPADEAGVQAGWLIMARDGIPLGANAGFSLKEGQVARYDFVDAQDVTKSLDIKARTLPTGDRLDLRELDGGIVYLRFDTFERASRRWLSEQLKAHRNAPAVIVDLRRNPGGSLFSLDITVGEFFQKTVSVGTFIKRSGTHYDEGTWQWGSAHYAGRMVVLVDGASASSAEIFAQALQFHHRATLIGRKTAGAVVASRFYGLPYGGELQIGVLDYIGLNGFRAKAQRREVRQDGEPESCFLTSNQPSADRFYYHRNNN